MRFCHLGFYVYLRCMNYNSSPYAFTGSFPLYRGRIVSDIYLCSTEEGNPNAIRIRALWDTGCSNSIISKRAADFLSLKPVGKLSYRTPFGGAALKSITEAKICVVLGGCRIPLSVGIDDTPCSDPDCDITLGLDFITQGDFAITHDGQRLVLSFCYPPISYPTDFTVILHRVSNVKVETETCEINENDTIEQRRRGLIMLDYFDELAKAVRK